MPIAELYIYKCISFIKEERKYVYLVQKQLLTTRKIAYTGRIPLTRNQTTTEEIVPPVYASDWKDLFHKWKQKNIGIGTTLVALKIDAK